MYYEKTIKDFGAVGNGMTDDTAALQKALNSGETVFFPAGVYLVRDQLETSGSVHWIGTGERSIIRLMPAETSRKTQSFRGMEVYDTRMILIKDAGSVTFRHLTLDANKEAFDTTPPHSRYDYTTCLDIWGAERVILDDVTVRGGLIEGVYIDRTANIRITKSRFIENGFCGEDAAGIQIVGNFQTTPNILISDCEFCHNGFNGLELNGVYGAVVNNITCSHNNCDGVALWGGSSLCQFSNVFAEDNRGGMNFRRNHSAGFLDVKQEDADSFCTDIIVNGLVTVGNKYGIMWGCAQNIFINGWIGYGDDFQHALCYLSPGEDITGEIRSSHVRPHIGEIYNDILNPADGEVFEELGAVPYGDPDKFKITYH